MVAVRPTEVLRALRPYSEDGRLKHTWDRVCDAIGLRVLVCTTGEADVGDSAPEAAAPEAASEGRSTYDHLAFNDGTVDGYARHLDDEWSQGTS